MPAPTRSGRSRGTRPASGRPRNDIGQYDDLAGEWWKRRGAFAALHWLARSRGRLIPPPRRNGAVLVDVGTGAGLLSPHVRGYRHVGVDLVASALRLASSRGVRPVLGDAAALPLRSEVADVVVAGEVLEHVRDLDRSVAEIARVLRPGGTVVLDTINDTVAARFALVTVGERVPGGPPPRIHDPRLFVSPHVLRRSFARHGVAVSRPWGLRPSIPDYIGFLTGRRTEVRMVRTRSVAAVYQAVGTKMGR